MATDDLDITSNDWRIVRENLVQLHCEDVSWEHQILCYWCRDFLPKEQANHKVAQCPYQKQAKDSWWKNQLGNVQREISAPQPDNKEN